MGEPRVQSLWQPRKKKYSRRDEQQCKTVYTKFDTDDYCEKSIQFCD